MSKTGTELIDKRRKEVGRLYLDNNVSITDIAKVMQLDKSTISDDVHKYVLPELASKYNPSHFLDSHRTRLAALETQSMRLRARVDNDDGHKYETLLIRNYEVQQQFYKDLIEASPDDDRGDMPISALRFDEFVKLVGYPIEAQDRGTTTINTGTNEDI